MTVTSVMGKRLADGECPMDAVSPQRKKACSQASPAGQARVQPLKEQRYPGNDAADAQVQQKKRLRLAKPSAVLHSNNSLPGDAPEAQAKKAKLQHEAPANQPAKEPKVFICMHTGEGLERDELEAARAAMGEGLAAAAAQPCNGPLPEALPAINVSAGDTAVCGDGMAEDDWQQLFDGLKLGQRSGPSTPAKHEGNYHGSKAGTGHQPLPLLPGIPEEVRHSSLMQAYLAAVSKRQKYWADQIEATQQSASMFPTAAAAAAGEAVTEDGAATAAPAVAAVTADPAGEAAETTKPALKQLPGPSMHQPQQAKKTGVVSNAAAESRQPQQQQQQQQQQRTALQSKQHEQQKRSLSLAKACSSSTAGASGDIRTLFAAQNAQPEPAHHPIKACPICDVQFPAHASPHSIESHVDQCLAAACGDDM